MKIGKKWLMHVRLHSGPTHGYMKCFTCEEFHVNLQKLYICDHDKSNDHKSMVTARWEALHFPPTGLVFITHHACASI